MSLKNRIPEKLVEIKKGQTGVGLLIESDGYVSADMTENNKKIIKEAFDSMESGEWKIPNPFVLDVVLQKYGIKNHNGRIYPENILKPEVEKYQKLIKERMALGECNHPAESTIDLGRISHNIIECHWEGHTLVGKIEFNLTEGYRRYGICSSLGDTCANLIINGYKIGVSSRGVGEVSNRMGISYVDNYELICWDIVATPSTPGSYIGTKQELQQYVEDDETKKKKSKINEKIDKIKSILG